MAHRPSLQKQMPPRRMTLAEFRMEQLKEEYIERLMAIQQAEIQVAAIIESAMEELWQSPR